MSSRGNAPQDGTGSSVSGTPAALEVMDHLEAAHGPLLLHQSGGCCDGSSPICVGADELPAGPHDVLLGTVGRTPVYIDGDLYERWGRPQSQIDVAPGAAEGFSMEGLAGVHFVTHTASV